MHIYMREREKEEECVHSKNGKVKDKGQREDH